MTKEPTRFDRFTDTIKNHKIGSIVVVLFLAVIALGNLTEALDNIARFWNGQTPSTSQSSINKADNRGSSNSSNEPSKKVASHSANENEIENASISFVEFIREYERLQERFQERENFIQELVGNRVSWTGYVWSVSSLGQQAITLNFTSESPSRGEMRFARFDTTLASRLFSLRKGDRIQIDGVFRADSSYPGGWLEGQSINFIGASAQ